DPRNRRGHSLGSRAAGGRAGGVIAPRAIRLQRPEGVVGGLSVPSRIDDGGSGSALIAHGEHPPDGNGAPVGAGLLRVSPVFSAPQGWALVVGLAVACAPAPPARRAGAPDG